MQMIHVESSSIDAIGYDPSTNALRIQFVNGTAYEYEEVPKELYQELMAAESIGKCFAAKVRNHFRGKRLKESAA